MSSTSYVFLLMYTCVSVWVDDHALFVSLCDFMACSTLDSFVFCCVLLFFLPVVPATIRQEDCAFTHAEILGLKLLFALMDQVI